MNNDKIFESIYMETTGLVNIHKFSKIIEDVINLFSNNKLTERQLEDDEKVKNQLSIIYKKMEDLAGTMENASKRTDGIRGKASTIQVWIDDFEKAICNAFSLMYNVEKNTSIPGYVKEKLRKQFKDVIDKTSKDVLAQLSETILVTLNDSRKPMLRNIDSSSFNYLDLNGFENVENLVKRLNKGYASLLKLKRA